MLGERKRYCYTYIVRRKKGRKNKQPRTSKMKATQKNNRAIEIGFNKKTLVLFGQLTAALLSIVALNEYFAMAASF